MITTNPTVGSNVEEVVHRNVRFQVWDLGGQDKLRKVWSTYYVGAHAVVLVIDSMDRDRIPLVYEELASITANEACALGERTPGSSRVGRGGSRCTGRLISRVYGPLPASQELRRAALLVLANKQDLEGAMSPIEITHELKLHLNKDHAWQIQPCSAVTGAGLFEGMVRAEGALNRPRPDCLALTRVMSSPPVVSGLGRSHVACKAMKRAPNLIQSTHTRALRMDRWQGCCLCFHAGASRAACPLRRGGTEPPPLPVSWVGEDIRIFGNRVSKSEV